MAYGVIMSLKVDKSRLPVKNTSTTLQNLGNAFAAKEVKVKNVCSCLTGEFNEYGYRGRRSAFPGIHTI